MKNAQFIIHGISLILLSDSDLSKVNLFQLSQQVSIFQLNIIGKTV